MDTSKQDLSWDALKAKFLPLISVENMKPFSLFFQLNFLVTYVYFSRMKKEKKNKKLMGKFSQDCCVACIIEMHVLLLKLYP